MINNDEIYLSYKNICLRKSDVNCFLNNNLINDMCISFYFEYLNEKLDLTKKDLFLFDPASISMILFDDDIEDLCDMFESCRLNDKEYLFIPVNDISNKYNAGGGQHWALIVYQISSDTFYYFDSMSSYIKNTEIICKKIKAILKLKTDKIKIKLVLNEKLQLNMYDCGIFVIKFVEEILNFMLEEDSKIDVDTLNKVVTEKVNQNKIKNERTKIMEIINKLKYNK